MPQSSLARALASFALLLALTPAAVGDVPAFGPRLAHAAAAQIGLTRGYDPRYQRLAYPGGDVAMETGVCTDVLVRAFRQLGIDLQVVVHEDMQVAWAAYPKLWNLQRPDRNIDHRRVPNLQVYFTRHGESLPPSSAASDYQAGDIVSWRLPSGVPHIGLVSTRREQGHPWVIHNIGGGVQEENVLFAYTITGHYRYPAPAQVP
jgi:uncharacterized protein